MGAIKITLAEDVAERLKRESEARGTSVEATANELIRAALPNPGEERDKRFKVVPFDLGAKLQPQLNYDCTGELLEFLEGPDHF